MRLQNRDVLGAIELLREAVRISPRNGQYQLQLGLALAHNPRWLKEAEKHLLEAQKFEPLNVQVFLKLGEIYHTSGLHKRAESQYRAALNVDPLNYKARKALTDMGLDVPPLTGRRTPAKEAEKSSGFLGKLFKKK
jgi:tetratricopeptide (TPR) repeat protein